MMSNDNSVNLVRSYHHGGLRAAVLAAAVVRLEAAVETLSLREVARDVGVSATAIYRHFANKDALLAALAADGAERMAAVGAAAGAAAGAGRDEFDACGRAYVLFAIANPGLFRLICANLPPGDPFAGDVALAWPPMRLLRERVDALLPDASAVVRKIVGLQAWSLAHGLACLMIDGQVPRDPRLVDAVVNSRGFAALA